MNPNIQQPTSTAPPVMGFDPLMGQQGNPAANAPLANPVKTNANSTQNTLLISEIRDGIVIMSDGSFRAVVMCKSINFDLMSPQEREGVEYSFQGFLNSLYFPIQIFIRSSKIDIRPYLEKLDKIRSEHDNMLLAYLMEDYIEFVTNVAQQTNIMDKKFYVVVPFFPPGSSEKIKEGAKGLLASIIGQKDQTVVINEDDLEKAKAELRNRVQTIMAGLQQSGVQSLPLDTQELIELYYDAYNPDTATRQQLKNFNDLTAPVVTKGVGEAINPNLVRGTM
jgi:type IV secretory pathway VirB4 component